MLHLSSPPVLKRGDEGLSSALQRAFFPLVSSSALARVAESTVSFFTFFFLLHFFRSSEGRKKESARSSTGRGFLPSCLSLSLTSPVCSSAASRNEGGAALIVSACRRNRNNRHQRRQRRRLDRKKEEQTIEHFSKQCSSVSRRSRRCACARRRARWSRGYVEGDKQRDGTKESRGTRFCFFQI